MVKVRNRKFLFGLKYTILTLLALAGICFGQYKWEMKNPLPMDNNFTSITHVNNQFVAVGDEGTILTSPDGTAWVVQNSGTTVNLNSLAFGNNQFVAVGEKIISVTHGGSHAMVLASSDGITWSIKHHYNDRFYFVYYNSVIFGNGKFVVAGWALLMTCVKESAIPRHLS